MKTRIFGLFLAVVLVAGMSGCKEINLPQVFGEKGTYKVALVVSCVDGPSDPVGDRLYKISATLPEGAELQLESTPNGGYDWRATGTVIMPTGKAIPVTFDRLERILTISNASNNSNAIAAPAKNSGVKPVSWASLKK